MALPERLDPARVDAVFLDLDGTIVEGGLPVPTAAAAIAALEAAGIRALIATGRMHRSTRRIAAEVGARGPLVCYQGALVGEADSDRVLAHHPLEAAAAREIVAAIAAEGVHVNAFARDEVHVAVENDEARRYAANARAPLHVVGDLVAWIDEPITKLVASGTPERMDELRDVLVPRFGDRAFIAKSLPYFLEVAAPGVSKAHGCETVCGLLGLDPARCVAVGDGENDLEMVAWAGFGVAVGGGFPGLAETADWVSPPLAEDGVPRFLEALAAARA